MVVAFTLLDVMVPATPREVNGELVPMPTDPPTMSPLVGAAVTPQYGFPMAMLRTSMPL